MGNKQIIEGVGGSAFNALSDCVGFLSIMWSLSQIK